MVLSSHLLGPSVALETSIALVDDHLVARLPALFPDHNGRIAGLTLLDDRGAALVARALADRYAGTNRADAHADTSFFRGRNARSQGNTRRGYQNKCAFHRSVPQVLPNEITAHRGLSSAFSGGNRWNKLQRTRQHS